MPFATEVWIVWGELGQNLSIEFGELDMRVLRQTRDCRRLGRTGLQVNNMQVALADFAGMAAYRGDNGI